MTTALFFFTRQPSARFKHLTNQRLILDQTENPTILFHLTAKYLTNQRLILDQNENPSILFRWTAARVMQVFDQPTLKNGQK